MASDERLTKKIAQLTKVIVHLNAKNEDFEQEKRQIILAYEEEIQVILEDARQRVHKLEGSLTGTLAQEEHQRLLGEVEGVYTKQRLEDEVKFNQHCQSLNDQLLQSNERHQERDQQLHALKQQVITLQQDVTAISTSAGFKLKDAQRKHAQEVQALTTQHDLRLQGQHDAATKSLALLQSDLEAAQQLLRQNELNLSAKDSAVQEFQTRMEQMDSDHRQASDENNTSLAKAAAELQEARVLLAEQVTATSTAQQQILQARHDLQTTSAKCSLAENLVAQTQTELAAARAEVEQLQRRLSETAEMSTADANALSSKLASLTTELSDANTTVATQGKTIHNLDVYCKKAEAALEASATELIKAKKELARLQLQSAEVDNREQAHQAERLQLLQDRDEADAAHKRILVNLHAQHESELKAQESKLLERLGMATRRYDEQEKQIQLDKDRSEAGWSAQRKQWQETEQQLKAKVGDRQLQIERLELRLADSSSLSKDLDRAHNDGKVACAVGC